MSSFLPLSLQVRQIISKLCEDSETLPAGYLIDQLTKMTFDRFVACAPFYLPSQHFFLQRRVHAHRGAASRESGEELHQRQAQDFAHHQVCVRKRFPEFQARFAASDFRNPQLHAMEGTASSFSWGRRQQDGA
jgi:hypothetical protein